jgi:hypothetical protein
MVQDFIFIQHHHQIPLHNATSQRTTPKTTPSNPHQQHQLVHPGTLVQHHKHTRSTRLTKQPLLFNRHIQMDAPPNVTQRDKLIYNGAANFRQRILLAT